MQASSNSMMWGSEEGKVGRTVLGIGKESCSGYVAYESLDHIVLVSRAGLSSVYKQ